MSRRFDDWIIHRMPRIVIGLSAIALILGMVATYTLLQAQSAKDEVDQNQSDTVRALRENQYVNCVRSANGLRRQVRREFVDLKDKALIPVFSRVAATIPEGAPAKLILEDTVDYLEHRIRTIRERIPNVNCRKRYPPLPGQHFGQVRPNTNGGGDGRSTNVRPSGEPAPDTGPTTGPESPGAGGSSGVGGSDGGANTQPPPSPPSPPPPPTNPPPQPPPSAPNPPPAPAPSGPLDGLTGPLNDTLDGVTNDAQQTVCNLPVRLCP